MFYLVELTVLFGLLPELREAQKYLEMDDLFVQILPLHMRQKKRSKVRNAVNAYYEVDNNIHLHRYSLFDKIINGEIEVVFMGHFAELVYQTCPESDHEYLMFDELPVIRAALDEKRAQMDIIDALLRKIAYKYFVGISDQAKAAIAASRGQMLRNLFMVMLSEYNTRDFNELQSAMGAFRYGRGL